jgi:hypothetical protein
MKKGAKPEGLAPFSSPGGQDETAEASLLPD